MASSATFPGVGYETLEPVLRHLDAKIAALDRHRLAVDEHIASLRRHRAAVEKRMILTAVEKRIGA
eukprot:10866531-Alexandrium_andersonii.AAC.1